MLKATAEVFRHGTAKTLYVAIPSRMAQDSTMPFTEGDVVELEIKGKVVEMRKK
jgi:hypothetical protein